MTRRPLLLFFVGFLLAACTGSSGTSHPQSGTLVVGGFNPFTGPDAAFGPEMMAGCFPAVVLINRDGGVLGHQLKCLAVDTRGDPADAVPAASKLAATTPNLIGVLGPSSDEADATAPIFEQSKIPMFADTGEASFDQSSYKYFWRLTPSDGAAGYAMAAWAKHQGYLQGAAIFGNDISSQANVPTLLRGYAALGGTMVNEQRIALDQASYRTEVEKMAATHPQVIFTEADPQSDAALLSELQQLQGLVPVIGTEPTLQPNWLQAVSGAIGQTNLSKYYVGVQPYAPPSGPSWQVFNQALLASSAQVPKPSQWSSDPYTMTDYDAVVVMALSMIAAKSTDPSVYNSYVIRITQASTGATVVHSFQEGKAALASGKTIQYVGAGGPIIFDQWHNSAGGFEVAKYLTSGKTELVGTVTAAEIAQLSGK